MATSKLFKALLIVFIIEAVIFMFSASEVSKTSLFYFLTHITNWTNMSLLNLVFNSVKASTLGAIAIGGLITGRDWIWRLTLAGTFITFIIVLGGFFEFISAGLAGSFPSLDIGIINLVTALLISPLALYCLIAILDFITGKD